MPKVKKKIDNSIWYNNPKCSIISEMLYKNNWRGIYSKEFNISKPEDNKNKSCNSIIKIRLHPNKEQKLILNKFFNQSRFIYNKLIECFYKKYKTAYWLWADKSKGFKYGREQWATKEAIKRKIKYGHVPKYLELDNIPAHIVSNNLNDICSSINTIKSLYKNGVIKKWPKIKYKSYKDTTSIILPKLDIREVTNEYISMFPRFFKDKKIKIKGLNNLEIKHDCRLQKLPNCKFYLCIPNDKDQINNKKDNLEDYNVCSIDPGIRTFLTVYDPKTNKTEKYGNCEDLKRIKIRLKIIDSINSKLSKLSKIHGKKERRIRYELRKKIKCLYQRIRNIRKDMHHNFSKKLLDKYDIIYLPNYEIKKFDLTNSNNKNARCWGFFEFKTILKDKASLYSNKSIIDCSEEYTSKACSKCFKIHEKLGGLEVFECPHCKHKIDRDENGAINILIKNLVC